MLAAIHTSPADRDAFPDSHGRALGTVVEPNALTAALKRWFAYHSKSGRSPLAPDFPIAHLGPLDCKSLPRAAAVRHTDARGARPWTIPPPLPGSRPHQRGASERVR
jgi:hypothetical protein